MTAYINKEPNHVLDNLKDELGGNQRGYCTELVLDDEPFSDNGAPRIEIELINPKDDQVAFRRVSHALSGDTKDGWEPL